MKKKREKKGKERKTNLVSLFHLSEIVSPFRPTSLSVLSLAACVSLPVPFRNAARYRLPLRLARPQLPVPRRTRQEAAVRKCGVWRELEAGGAIGEGLKAKSSCLRKNSYSAAPLSLFFPALLSLSLFFLARARAHLCLFPASPPPFFYSNTRYSTIGSSPTAPQWTSSPRRPR